MSQDMPSEILPAASPKVRSDMPHHDHAKGTVRANDTGYRYHAVEQQVKAMIESGRYVAGDRLPSLRSLSATMGVSLATVTQAYMELERKGVVEARPRSGYFVLPHKATLPLPQANETEVSAPEAVNRVQLIQTVLDVVGNTDIVPFGCVCPDPELLPGKTLARIMNDVLRQTPELSLGYSSINGHPEYRRQVAGLTQRLGIRAWPDDVISTSGAMEALYISLRCLTRPGDNVIIQSPTYFCFLQLLENLGLRAIEIPSCPEYGIDPADLAEALRTYHVSACILSPNYNNPDGALMSDDVKKEVLALLRESDVQLVEDDVSGDLHFGPVRPSPIKRYDTEGRVTLCSSFSKTVAPGYRAGWMLPGRLMQKALEIKATTNVCCPAPTQMAVAEYLRGGYYERHLKRLRAAMERQTHIMRHHLGEYFPEGTGVTSPEGGGVLWVYLPNNVEGVDMFFKAKARGIGIAPGSIFSTREDFDNYIRLSCGGVWNETMQQAMKTLGELASQSA